MRLMLAALMMLTASTAARADVAQVMPPAATGPGSTVTATQVPGGLAGAQAWRVRYRSTDGRGRRIEVTGWVFVPPGGNGVAPIIGWAHGSWGVAGKCAIADLPGLVAATPALTDMLARGHVVAATDYVGFGAGNVHPYLVGESAGRSVIDIVRAARQLGGAGDRFAVWGESQGGHAALWTGRIAQRYAPELTLVGVAAAAPPTDLVANLTSGGDPSVRAFLTAYTADSWSRYFGAPLAKLGRPATAGLIRRLAQNNCIELDAKPRLGTALGVLALRRDLRGVDLGRIEPWAQLARSNSVASTRFAVPLLIAQNPADKIVAPAVTRTFARATCRAGTRVRWVDIVGQGHATSARDSAKVTLDWIDARFAEAPAPNDCGRL